MLYPLSYGGKDINILYEDINILNVVDLGGLKPPTHPCKGCVLSTIPQAHKNIAEGGTRTLTILQPTDFKSVASTNSATTAKICRCRDSNSAQASYVYITSSDICMLTYTSNDLNFSAPTRT